MISGLSNPDRPHVWDNRVHRIGMDDIFVRTDRAAAATRCLAQGSAATPAPGLRARPNIPVGAPPSADIYVDSACRPDAGSMPLLVPAKLLIQSLLLVSSARR